jgi:hypothetical protein
MTDALHVSSDLHGGTAGVVDDRFYREIFAYLGAQHAPALSRQAFAFQRALWSWDFAAASALADTLAPDAAAGGSWYPVDDLRDGATIAKLALGDVDGARRVWVQLQPRTKRRPDSVRSLLIGAYVIAADRARKAHGTTQPAR